MAAPQISTPFEKNVEFAAREVICNNEWRIHTELTVEFAAFSLLDKVSTDPVVPNDLNFAKTVTNDVDQLDSSVDSTSQTPEVLAMMPNSPETTKIVEGGKNSPIKENEEEQEDGKINQNYNNHDQWGQPTSSWAINAAETPSTRYDPYLRRNSTGVKSQLKHTQKSRDLMFK